jgi:choline dehydrogenase
LRAAAKENAIDELTEINCGAPYTGFVHVQSTVRNGERESAARAFLVPIRDNQNFYFMKESLVDKVLLEKDPEGHLVVKGVSVLTPCKNIILQAKREVILSAGGYGSPQILLRSGIGRDRDLQKCDIPQLKSLPVGHNLSDHFVTVHFFTMPGNLTSTAEKAKNFFDRHCEQYFSNRTGFFSTAGMNFQWFVNTKDRKSDYPDVQIIFGLIDQNTPDFDVNMKEKFGYKKEFADQLIKANKEQSLVQVLIILLNPESRGNVEIRDCNDPCAPLIINGNYLNNEKDVNTVLNSIEILNDFFNSNEMKNAGIQPLDIDILKCNNLDSREYNRCYIKHFSHNVWHPTGTCMMGVSAEDSVVDSKLRVFGVKKTEDTPMLRVSDASIMPLITSGNTQCPTYAIGEKAAAMIITDDY